MTLMWVFQWVEGLAFCVGSGALAVAQPKLFLKQLTAPGVMSTEVENSETTLFVTRLFGLTAVALGGVLLLILPDLKKSQRNTLLRCLLIGDSLQVFFAVQHEKAFGGLWTQQAITQYVTGGGLALCRLWTLFYD